MTDEQALLAAVLDNPGDDTVRLVMADWLDEHAGSETCGTCGGKGKRKDFGFHNDYTWEPCPTCRGTGRVANGYAARAEFIRVQCELARRAHHAACVSTCGPPEFEGCPQRTERKRELELFAAHQFGWFALPTNWQTALDRREADGRPLAVVSRGFISSLTLPAAAFTETLAKAVFGVQPVMAVVLNDREPVHDMSSLEIHAAARVGSWDWYEPPHGDPDFPESVPSPVFAVMWDDYPEYQAHTGDGEQRWLEFPACDAALLALNRAAVDWGRSLVKLPPLEVR